MRVGTVVPSPIELLHPDGAARTALVLGAACPRRLAPAAPAPDSGERADVVVIAPTTAESGRHAWLQEAAAAAAAAAAPEGIVYVISQPRARRVLRSLLTRRGLAHVGSFVHVPDHATSRHLVPLQPDAFRHAFSSLLPVSARTRRVSAILRRAPSLAPVGWTAGSVGVAFARRPSRPLLAWVFAAEDGTRGGSAIVSLPLAPDGSPVLHVFAAGRPRPSFVVKLVGDARRAHDRRETLIRLGPAAAAAGANVPTVVRLDLSGRPAVVESAVPGASAYALLLARRRTFEAVGEAIATWLERWNAATSVERRLTPALLREAVLDPLAVAGSDLADDGALRSRLERLCERLEGATVPLVAAHRDLTMSNVLVDDEVIGVVDWEHAAERALPLTDLVYAVADAAAAGNAYVDRVAAARACFDRGGAHADAVSAWLSRSARRLGLGDDVEELCFHACWLHHAANEARAGAAPGPFRAVLEWLARGRR